MIERSGDVFILARLTQLMQRQQMQIVIAQHGLSCRTEVLDEGQTADRVRPPVDQVAGQPESVVQRVKADVIEQGGQRTQATLQVTDSIEGHSGLLAYMVGDANKGFDR